MVTLKVCVWVVGAGMPAWVPSSPGDPVSDEVVLCCEGGLPPPPPLRRQQGQGQSKGSAVYLHLPVADMNRMW